MNFEEIAALDAERRAALDRRASGKAMKSDTPAPEGETPSQANLEGGAVAFDNLSEAEAADLIAKAEGGDDGALEILESKLASSSEPLQAGDGGAIGRQGSTMTPGEAFNKAVRASVGIGRRRQHARRSNPGIMIGGVERRL